MRDYLPAGTVRGVIKEHVWRTNSLTPLFTNQHLAAMAFEYAEDIRRGHAATNP